VCRKRQWRGGDGLFEAHAVARQAIDRRRLGAAVAVRTQPVSSSRVERYDEQVQIRTCHTEPQSSERGTGQRTFRAKDVPAKGAGPQGDERDQRESDSPHPILWIQDIF